MTSFKRTFAALAAAAVLGAAAGTVAGDAANFGPPWQKALGLRSDALNRNHGLGERAAARAQEQGWQYALRVRSEGLNERYGLGDETG